MPTTKKGNDLETFMRNWDHVVDSLPPMEATDDMLYFTFYKAIVHVPALAYQMSVYHSRPRGHPEKNYRKLRKFVTDSRLSERSAQNMAERDRLLDET